MVPRYNRPNVVWAIFLLWLEGEVEMKQKLEEILQNGLKEIDGANDLKVLDEIRVKYLGKQDS